MSESNAIQLLGYGAFYDFPHEVCVAIGDRILALKCEFDPIQDDYQDYYLVSELAGATTDDFYTGKSTYWTYEAMPIGQVSLSDVRFDASKRTYLQSVRLEDLVHTTTKAPSPSPPTVRAWRPHSIKENHCPLLRIGAFSQQGAALRVRLFGEKAL